tara:strand:- start:871 stop:1167 length:297 start_codon:yes stop_codon:yes gene_type:complete
MKFIQVIQNKKFTLITMFLFLYVLLNFFDGERGLISYFEKNKIKKQLEQEKEFLVNKLASIEKQNSLLTETLDLDYLEILYRKKFMYGKSNEEIYLIK